MIVDDGSTDRTSKVAFGFVKQHKIDNVRVLLLGRNHGKGEAVRKVSVEIPGYPLGLRCQIKTNWCFPFCFCGSMVYQGMLHSRGELLLMLDADGATKVTDLEKLEAQVCLSHKLNRTSSFEELIGLVLKEFFFWNSIFCS